MSIKMFLIDAPMGCMDRISHPELVLVAVSVISALVCFELGWSMWSILEFL